jgi:lipoprotein-anchoring transpeptidase ErfK/SrfK
MSRPRRIPLGGTATLVAVAVACGCSEHKSAAPAHPKPPPAATTTTVRSVSVPQAQPKTSTPKPSPKPKREPRKPGQAPKPHGRAPAPAVPWHGRTISLVAHARHRRLAVYARPHAKRPLLLLRNPDGNGTPRVVLVRAQRSGWVRVYLPTRPNGGSGWVRDEAVRLLRDPYRVVVYLRRHRLELWKGRRRVVRAPTVVGARGTPTPLGLYYVVELLRPPDPAGSYGPYSFGISAHSNVLKRFAGGDGRVGIHGTNAPWLLGNSVSHGCVRVRNDTIRRLARVLPLGTPVLIRA